MANKCTVGETSYVFIMWMPIHNALNEVVSMCACMRLYVCTSVSVTRYYHLLHLPRSMFGIRKATNAHSNTDVYLNWLKFVFVETGIEIGRALYMIFLWHMHLSPTPSQLNLLGNFSLSFRIMGSKYMNRQKVVEYRLHESLSARLTE